MAKYDAKRMRALLARKDAQGLTYGELSEETGIPIGTLSYWRSRLRGEQAPLFEEVMVEDERRERGSIEIVGPLGHRVLVGGDVDADLLRRVLEALPC